MKKRCQPWLLMVGLGLLAGCNGEESDSGRQSSPSLPLVPRRNPPTTWHPRSTRLPYRQDRHESPAARAAPPRRRLAAPSLEGPKSDAGQGDGKSVKLTSAEEANIKKLPADEQPAALSSSSAP